MSRKTNTSCKHCGTAIYVRPSHLITTGNFCSSKCYNLYKKERSTIQCSVCKKSFHKKNKTQQFCSVVCAASRPRVKKWNGTTQNKSKNLKEELLVLGWDGKCMHKRCTYSRLLDVHRIVPGKDGGTYTLSNVCVLCPNHHTEIHRLNFKLVKIDRFNFNVGGRIVC